MKLIPLLILSFLFCACVTDFDGIGPSSGDPPKAGEGNEPDAGLDGATVESDSGPMDSATAQPDASFPPRVVSSVPAFGETDVAPNTELMLTFDQPVVAAEGTVELLNTLSQELVESVDTTGPNVTINGTVVQVELDSVLPLATQYEVLVSSGAFRNAAELHMAPLETDWLFTTAQAAPLELDSTLPKNNTTDVPLDTNLELRFNQEISLSSEGYLTLIESTTDTEVEVVLISDGTKTSVDGNTLFVDLEAVLKLDTRYHVLLDQESVQTTDGSSFPGIDSDTTFTFQTLPPPPLSVRETFPANGATGVDPNASVVFVFSEAITTGSGSLSIYREDGTQVQSVGVTHPSVTVSGNTLTVDFNSALELDQGYYITISGNAVLSEQGAKFVGIDGPGEDGLTFRTSSGAVVALALVSSDPADGDMTVAIDSSVTLTFSAEVEPGGGSVVVVDTANPATEFVVDVMSSAAVFDGTDVVLKLPTSLRGSTDYHVTVGPGAIQSAETEAVYEGIKDSTTLNFRTGAAFELDALSPTQGALDADRAADLVLTFTEDVAKSDTGTVTVLDGSTEAVETIPIDDPRISVSGNRVIIDLDSILSGNREHTVTISAGAFEESSGSGSSIAFEAGDWTFTTLPLAAPADISAGLVLWLDADYGQSIKQSSGVRLWADRSGQRRNLTQATAGARPALNNAAMNERDTLFFDGTDDMLLAASGLDFSSLEGYVVFRSPETSSSSQNHPLISNGRNFEVNHGHPGSPRLSMSSCVGQCDDVSDWHSAHFVPAPSVNTPYLWNFGYNGVTTVLFARTNGGAEVIAAGATDPPVAPATPLEVAGDVSRCEPSDGCFFSGEIAEIIVYSRNLNQADQLAVTGYLQNKWGISASECATANGETRGSNGKCYYYSNDNATWTASRTACRNRGDGWDLASVKSELDHTIISSIITSDTWLGGTDTAIADTWRWVKDGSAFWNGGLDGSPAAGAYSRWSSDQPTDQANNEQCLRYYQVDSAWYWADLDCGEFHRYICEGPGQ